MQKHFIIVLVTNHENIPLHTFSVLIWGIDFTRGYAALTPGCIIAPIQGAGGMRHCVARLILWFTYINSLFTIHYSLFSTFHEPQYRFGPRIPCQILCVFSRCSTKLV